MSTRTDVYGIQVTNLTLDESYHATQNEGADLGGVPIDPVLPTTPVHLVAPFSLTIGHEPGTYPGPLAASTGTFSLFVNTAAGAAVPAWQTGHIVRLRVITEPFNEWWDPIYDGLPDEWVDERHVIADAVAAAVKGGLVLTFTTTDAWPALSGTPVSAGDRPKELAISRVQNALIPAVPASLAGLPVDTGLMGQFGQGGENVGPMRVEGTLGDLLTTAVAGCARADFGGDLGIPYPQVRYEDQYANGNPGPVWQITQREIPRFVAGEDTAYRLVLDGTVATPQVRDIDDLLTNDVSNTLDPVMIPSIVLDACYVPRESIGWQYARGVNAVSMDVIADDGSTQSVVREFADLRAADGALTRQVATQAAADNVDRYEAADNYLGDRDAAAARWHPRQLLIRTDQIPTHRLGYYAKRLHFSPGNASLTIAQVAIINADARWGIDDNGYALAGTIVSRTFTIAGGELTVTCQLHPGVPTPAPPSSPSDYDTASYQDLLDDAGLATVRYTDTPPGSPHIDPTLTYADMRLIGV